VQILVFHFLVYNHENTLETLYKRVCLSVQYIFYYNLDMVIDVNKHMTFEIATVTVCQVTYHHIKR
jgi:hypothetical protein